MLGGWKVEGVSELSDLILQSGRRPELIVSPQEEWEGEEEE